MTLKNDQISTYRFLSDMENDRYYPPQLVAKGQVILHDLCLQIEAGRPQTSEQLTELTHAATAQFNQRSSTNSGMNLKSRAVNWKRLPGKTLHKTLPLSRRPTASRKTSRN